MPQGHGVGQWRTTDDGAKIDPSGTLFDGTPVDSAVALRQALVRQPEIFVGVLTEKMLTYALGRGLEYYDMPAVRKIVHDGRNNDYRFSSIVMGVVKSAPFQLREAVSRDNRGAQAR